MPTHVVLQGECLSSLAARRGLKPEDLHNLPANAALKTNRPYPNILAPGDVVEIPEPKQKWSPAATERVNRFVLKRPKVKLRIALLNALGMPYEGKRFVITVAKKDVKGKTATGGLIECEVPAEEQSGHLRVWLDDDDPDPHIDRDLAIGHLDPIGMTTGVQARLENLGYPCTVTGETDEETLLALRRFRASHSLAEGDDTALHGPGEGGDVLNRTDDGGDSESATPAGEGEPNEKPAPESRIEKPIDDPVRTKLQGLYEAR